VNQFVGDELDELLEAPRVQRRDVPIEKLVDTILLHAIPHRQSARRQAKMFSRFASAYCQELCHAGNHTKSRRDRACSPKHHAPDGQW
jgi:hypothetical protein